jgi:hypothetical protein
MDFIPLEETSDCLHSRKPILNTTTGSIIFRSVIVAPLPPGLMHNSRIELPEYHDYCNGLAPFGYMPKEQAAF